MKYQSASSIVSVLVASFFAITVAMLPGKAAAQCAAPATSGVRICQPSANSVINGVPFIESAAEPSSGTITSMTVTLDGQQIFTNNGPEINLFDGAIGEGTHKMTITAVDSFGRSYATAETFTSTGIPPTTCPMSTVGVKICYPAAGQFVSQNMLMTFGFKGAANITHVRTYVDNTMNFDTATSGEQWIEGQGSPTTPGNHTLTVVAWDAQGHVYSSKVAFTAYYDGNCPPKGTTCEPGIYANTGPGDGQDVTSPFRVSFNVENNPAPITGMKAYLNGTVVAVSSGPTLDQQVNANKGTQILTIQAWDSAGKLYRLVENVNVQ
jgi:hypothetical protein